MFPKKRSSSSYQKSHNYGTANGTSKCKLIPFSWRALCACNNPFPAVQSAMWHLVRRSILTEVLIKCLLCQKYLPVSFLRSCAFRFSLLVGNRAVLVRYVYLHRHLCVIGVMVFKCPIKALCVLQNTKCLQKTQQTRKWQ